MRVFQNRSYCTIMNRSQAFFLRRVRVSSSVRWMPDMNRFRSLPEAQSLPQTKHSLRTARTGLYSRDEGAGTAHRLCPHARHALRDAPPHASGYGGNLPECPPRGDSGKCREPDECRCDFPFCRRAWHRCRAPHIRLQQPAVPPRHPREHGKCLPGPVDRAARRQLLAGAGNCCTAGTWILYRCDGIKRRLRSDG